MVREWYRVTTYGGTLGTAGWTHMKLTEKEARLFRRGGASVKREDPPTQEERIRRELDRL